MIDGSVNVRICKCADETIFLVSYPSRLKQQRQICTINNVYKQYNVQKLCTSAYPHICTFAYLYPSKFFSN
jgi:hypothetical protein